MTWDEIRKTFAGQWIVVEAKTARSVGGHRIVGDIAVLAAFQDPAEAQRRQLTLHRAEPAREILLTFAGWETLDIEETRWAGIRKAG